MLLFWLALLLPGFVAVRLFDARELKSGLPGVIALSMLASFALLSPINILGHTLRWPLWTMSVSVGALVLAGAVMLVRRRWWSELRDLLTSGVRVEMAILLAAMILAGVIGSFMGGDAVTHLSRIRLLLDQGLTNGHPFYGGEHFFPTYHTNLLHALIASCSQIAGGSHLLVWQASLPVALLLVVGGSYFLGWTVFERRWPAWIAALGALAMFGSFPYLIYPNKLAPLWASALTIAFAVQAVREPRDWRPIVKIAAAVLVVGQLHGMYAIFIAMVIAPVLAVAAAVHGVQRSPRPAVMLGASCIALCIGLAFPLYSAAQINVLDDRVTALFDDHDDEAGGGASAGTAEDGAGASPGTETRFGQGFTGAWWRPALLAGALLALLVLARDRRPALAVLAGVIFACAAWLYAPPLYDIAAAGLKGRWAVARLEFVLRLGFVVLVAGGAATALQRWIRPWWARSAMSVVVLAVLIVAVGPRSTYDWSWFAGQLRGDLENRRALRMMQELHAAGEAHLPADAEVVAPPMLGMALSAVTDCELVSAASSNLGVDNAEQRASDLNRLISESTRPRVRNRLIRRYGIDTVVTLERPRQWSLRRAGAVHDVRLPAMNTTLWIVTLRELP